MNRSTTHEILLVKDCARNTFEFIVVRNSGSSYVTRYGGRKYYANRTQAGLAIGNR